MRSRVAHARSMTGSNTVIDIRCVRATRLVGRERKMSPGDCPVRCCRASAPVQRGTRRGARLPGTREAIRLLLAPVCLVRDVWRLIYRHLKYRGGLRSRCSNVTVAGERAVTAPGSRSSLQTLFTDFDRRNDENLNSSHNPPRES